MCTAASLCQVWQSRPISKCFIFQKFCWLFISVRCMQSGELYSHPHLDEWGQTSHRTSQGTYIFLNFCKARLFQETKFFIIIFTAVNIQDCFGYGALRKLVQCTKDIGIVFETQTNLVIRNFLVTLKLFLNAKRSLSLWSKLAFGHGKWFLKS